MVRKPAPAFPAPLWVSQYSIPWMQDRSETDRIERHARHQHAQARAGFKRERQAGKEQAFALTPNSHSCSSAVSASIELEPHPADHGRSADQQAVGDQGPRLHCRGQCEGAVELEQRRPQEEQRNGEERPRTQGFAFPCSARQSALIGTPSSGPSVPLSRTSWIVKESSPQKYRVAWSCNEARYEEG